MRARLTSDLPALAGTYRTRPEDFLVDELLDLADDPEGTHLALRIEKRGLTTDEAVRRLATHLGVRPGSVGRAGRKDARAVTRQWLSVEHVDASALRGFGESPELRVLETRRARRKLRLGGFRANRFRLRLRGPLVARVALLDTALARLVELGLPNAFGPQRFGVDGCNAEIGAALVRGDAEGAVRRWLVVPRAADRPDVADARRLVDGGRFRDAARAFPPAFAPEARLCRLLADRRGRADAALRALGRRPLGLFVSAWQARLFNAVLEERLGAGLAPLEGDLPQGRPAVPTGPLFGPGMRWPGGDALALELRVLRAHGLELEHLEPRRNFVGLEGGRRPLHVPVADLERASGEDELGPWLELAFALPPGSFATALLDELGKGELVEPP